MCHNFVIKNPVVVLSILSVVFRWLINEISGKPISHKGLGAWVLVCGVVDRGTRC